MTSPDLHRDIGRLESEVAGLKEDLAEVRSDVRAMREMMSEVRGGWKVLVAAGGVGAALMAGLLKILPHIPWGR